MFKRKNKADEEETPLEEPIFGGAAAPDNLSTDFDSAFSDDEDQEDAFLEGQNDALVYDKTTDFDDEDDYDSVEDSEDVDYDVGETDDADGADADLEGTDNADDALDGDDMDVVVDDEVDADDADNGVIYEAVDIESVEEDVEIDIDEDGIVETSVVVEEDIEEQVLETSNVPDAPATEEYPDAIQALEPERVDEKTGKLKKSKPAHGKHGQVKDEPDYQSKSRRTRRMLIVVLILLVVLVGALGYFAWQLYQESQNIATQQINDSSVASSLDTATTTTKENATTTKKTQVPNLVSVLGKTQEEAITAIGHGAIPASSSAVNEEGNPVKTRVTVALTEESSDPRSGAPSVYLGLSEEGKVVMAGYSAATASLGYGSVSFSDAVSKEHIVQNTFGEAGLTLTPEDVVLPAKSEYSLYAGDGTTLVRESCSFNGETSQNGTAYKWTSVLTYDYTAANATGNLADTIRQIYIYVNL